MPPATIIPPAASVTQILRAACATGPRAEPSLMLPWIGPGKEAGKYVTAATDGEFFCLWTAGRVGRFKEWAALNPSLLRAGENATSPLQKFRPFFGGAHSHPLQLARRGKGGCWTLPILTGQAFLTDRQHQILSHCESCYLGPGTRKPVDGVMLSVSIAATVGKAIIHGVIICQPPTLSRPS